MKNDKTKQEIETHQVVSQDEWLTARLELLKAEKELTRHSDAVALKRQEMPWVQIGKSYRFDTDEGKVSLADLFKGRSQLLIYHFMFGPEYEGGCPSCSAIADGFNGFTGHLSHHDVMFWAVSRAPLEKLLAYRKQMEWGFPWASSSDSDFNYDFGVSFTEEQQRSGNIGYNYRKGNVSSRANEIVAVEAAPEAGKRIAARVNTDWATYTREAPGMSAFVLKDDLVYHTYSSYERGVDGLWGMYQWLDRAPLGRNEAEDSFWFRRHDEYDQKNANNGGSKSCCH